MKKQTDMDIVIGMLKAKSSTENGQRRFAQAMNQVRALNQKANRKVLPLQRQAENLENIRKNDRQAVVRAIMALTGVRTVKCRQCLVEIAPGSKFCGNCGAAITLRSLR